MQSDGIPPLGLLMVYPLLELVDPIILMELNLNRGDSEIRDSLIHFKAIHPWMQPARGLYLGMYSGCEVPIVHIFFSYCSFLGTWWGILVGNQSILFEFESYCFICLGLCNLQQISDHFNILQF